MPYVIGIDGGGTKTTCVFQKVEEYDPFLKPQREVNIGEGTNPLSVGFEQMTDRLHQLVQYGLEAQGILPGDVVGLCAGIAGTRLEANRLMVEHELKQLGQQLHLHPDAFYEVKSDLYVALRGAMQPADKEGILVICGTGSNAIGVSQAGHLIYNGGWGHILGDEGSGYSIGLQALKAVCKAYDRREYPTELTGMVLDALKLASEQELIHYIYREGKSKKEIASLARLVIEASTHSDRVAVAILSEAGDELVELVRGLMRKSASLHEAIPVTVAGSIFTYSDIIKNRFVEGLSVHRAGQYQPPYADPVEGAIKVAMEAISKPTI
ncbi:hypothetical protein BC351_28140 [Paenibacillus ferrarius]|uniref:ATPase BadF/BadG/BcrA/BcrD type domain-containing protein n=1 Tax=Paenibacillus ferrarius TaxID=1469647 RepID=A0A1V4HHU8_9BACL|nr:BadF/BadG/BcrA/BcrD ATPase family protein [Paenibacillus ferrarius]OPH56369.1 hypothetical protein BC351_28140 [Paenibacillus ferrarius]